jgi:adenylyltransferase/sulfurtransferase
MHDDFSQSELQRYSRHILIPEVGEAGQRRLKKSSVLLIGTGALGSPTAMYLAAAGIGRIGLVDDDAVDASNLQRQILHGESWIGQPKLESALARLREINPHITLEAHRTRFTPHNALQLAESYDLIVDGSDNFPTRFLTNDTAFFLRKPLVYGAIHRFEGQCTVFKPGVEGPCYRCLLPEMPAPGTVPSCAEAGVLGVIPGIIGSLQALEAMKILLEIGEVPLGKLSVFDGLSTSFRSLRLRRDSCCRLCGDSPAIHSISNPETNSRTSCTMNDSTIPEISITELRQLLTSDFKGLLIDVREPHEHAMANIPQAELIPLGTLAQDWRKLPQDREIYLHCKSGMRSANATAFLIERGFTKVHNVAGGIDAWLREA